MNSLQLPKSIWLSNTDFEFVWIHHSSWRATEYQPLTSTNPLPKHTASNSFRNSKWPILVLVVQGVLKLAQSAQEQHGLHRKYHHGDLGMVRSLPKDPSYSIWSSLERLTGWSCNNHLEKYEFVNGKDDIPYKKWKIPVMFETTNQIMEPLSTLKTLTTRLMAFHLFQDN